MQHVWILNLALPLTLLQPLQLLPRGQPGEERFVCVKVLSMFHDIKVERDINPVHKLTEILTELCPDHAYESLKANKV